MNTPRRFGKGAKAPNVVKPAGRPLKSQVAHAIHTRALHKRSVAATSAVQRVQQELGELERRLAELNSSTKVVVSQRRSFAGGGEYLEDVVVGERAPL